MKMEEQHPEELALRKVLIMAHNELEHSASLLQLIYSTIPERHRLWTEARMDYARKAIAAIAILRPIAWNDYQYLWWKQSAAEIEALLDKIALFEAEWAKS